MANNTIIKVPTPIFGINEIAYYRESAILGYIEPAKVAAVRFDASLNKTFYIIVYKKSGPNNQIVGDAIDLKSSKVIEVIEDELITYAEALNIKLRFLTIELEKTEEQLQISMGLPIIDVIPSTDGFDFGDESLTSDGYLTFNIVNTGNSNLILDSVQNAPAGVTISGDSDDFDIIDQPDIIIAPNGNSNFVIKFRPTDVGRRVGVVQILSNDPSNTALTFTIEGTGT